MLTRAKIKYARKMLVMHCYNVMQLMMNFNRQEAMKVEGTIEHKKKGNINIRFASFFDSTSNLDTMLHPKDKVFSNCS